MADINEKRQLDLFKRLVETDSPSYNERQVADLVKAELASMGISCDEDGAGASLNGNTGNIFARIEGDVDAPALLFSSHMDTVEPSHGKKFVQGEDGIIRSDGTTVLGADDFAGVCSLLEAVHVIRENNLPHRTIELLFTPAEEVFCGGAEYFDYSRLQAKEAYVFDLDGDIGTACIAAPTIIKYTINFKGKSAHAGFASHLGVHAIKAASAAVCAIECGQVDEETTVNIGVISGGKATNIVPDECQIIGEVRSFNHEKALQKAAEIKLVAEAEAAKIGASIEYSSTCNTVAYSHSEDSSVCTRFVSACRALGIEPKLEPSFGGSDNNSFAANGVTGVVCSTAMYDCHTTAEWCKVEELHKSARLALQLMLSKE